MSRALFILLALCALTIAKEAKEEAPAPALIFPEPPEVADIQKKDLDESANSEPKVSTEEDRMRALVDLFSAREDIRYDFSEISDMIMEVRRKRHNNGEDIHNDFAEVSDIIREVSRKRHKYHGN